MQSKDKIESGLERAGKTNPFSVPENYFQSFPEKLSKQLPRQKPSRVMLPERIWEILRPQLALVAAVTGFALIGYFGFRTFIQTENELLNNDIITEYINYYHHEFSEYHMISLLDETDIDPEDALYYEDEFYFSSPDEYMDYLYKDNIDINLIISEF